eukprot:CAMPEP_0198512452 /NCGR_PEP_ID=MMETSP1462-20131121/15458_1 /TAXON_ID=1333877 /ORGANISM="Brandtodinium nutriculum, Strain RCC3387" /LENGTH=65 /DNA_ID=CAMNT_0044241859 /DNA_START=15 /DNA_END=209 /DNA_ORIENTATION=-
MAQATKKPTIKNCSAGPAQRAGTLSTTSPPSVREMKTPPWYVRFAHMYHRSREARSVAGKPMLPH